MRYVILLSLILSGQAMAADTGLSPSSLKLQVFKAAVSTSPLCTNLTTIVDNGSTASEVNFVGGVNVGSGTVADGTYPCVVIEFASNIKFTPSENSDSGNCTTSSEETLDVCSSGTSVLIDGTTTTCASNSNDRVAMYLSTASTSTTGADAFNPPTSLSDATKGFTLGSALVVAGSASGKFVANPAGQVCDDNTAGCEGSGGGTGTNGAGTCHMGPPAFSFQ